MRKELDRGPIYDDEDAWQEPGVTPGREARWGDLRSVVAWCWRSVVVWMLLLALLSLRGLPWLSLIR